MASGIEPKTKEHWHIYWVLRDPEFRREAFAVSDYARAKYWKTKGIEDLTDEQREIDKKLVDELIKKYAISEKVLASSQTGRIASGVFDEAVISTEVEDQHDSIVVRFRSDVTRDEYVNAWDEIQRHLKHHGYKRGSTKRKPPQETSLLYAIFKARQRGETYKQIFWQYQQENLPGYAGSSTQFTSEDSLERYYQKYRPDKLPAT